MCVIIQRETMAETTETHNDNERVKTTRHPRWTRGETIILIEAKKVVENGGGTTACRFTQSEPKWDLVSSFCQKQGVNRGPVQCRKRWSNLLSDFKKIKRWESEKKKKEKENENENEEEGVVSFWMMRNDERREKKLPGFFDGEVYNVLDGGVCAAAAFPLALVKVTPAAAAKSKVEENGGDGVAEMGSEDAEEEEEEEEEAEAIVDSEKIGWSTEEETSQTMKKKKVIDSLRASGVIKETVMMTQNPQSVPASEHKGAQHLLPLNSQSNHKGSGKIIEHVSQEGCKRRRESPENCEDITTFNNPFMEVLRRNSNILKAHIGDQSINYQLARDQQKEQTSNLVAAISKLTDALTKIAEKL